MKNRKSKNLVFCSGDLKKPFAVSSERSGGYEMLLEWETGEEEGLLVTDSLYLNSSRW